jgi:hypothetical protein
MKYVDRIKMGLLLASTIGLLESGQALARERGDHTSYLTDRGCGTSESWSWDGGVPEEYRDDFSDFTARKMVPVQGFAEGIAVRRFALKPEFKTFGEYWIARALLDANLPHLAIGGFATIIANPLTDETAGYQIASLECVMRIQSEHSGLAVPTIVIPQLTALYSHANNATQKEILYDAAGLALRQSLASEKVAYSDVEPLFDILKGSGAHEIFAKALWASKHNDNRAAVKQWEALFALQTVPKSIRRYTDEMHVLAARAHYTVGEYAAAESHLKLVRKASNDLADSLSELAWAYLQDERYPEAIGTSVNLDAGGLRHTFTPEAPMVMAMAMNEICQYPESVSAINRFRKDYEKSYRWLDVNKDVKNYYPLAADFVRKQGTVPDRVGSEWVRSPLYIASQDEINLLFDEKESSNTLQSSGGHESHRLILDILKRIEELKPKWAAAKMKRKAGQDMPQSLVNEVSRIRRMVLHYRRLNAAAPVWQAVMKNYRKGAPGLEKQLIARINEDIGIRSKRMHAQLEEIAENIQLIEVEIYNGASQDIIWQNAHPDYRKMAEQMKEDNVREAREKTWDWGRTPASSEENMEVWEDELGSAAVNLVNNCSSKDRFLAIRMKGHS